MPLTNKDISFPNFLIEDSCSSPSLVAGVDEAGRGSLFGDVVAAAAWIDRDLFPSDLLLLMNDSKKLTSKKRDYLYDELMKLDGHSVFYGIGVASPAEIDQVNILNATHLAMYRAMQILLQRKSDLKDFLIDGNRVPSDVFENIQYTPIIQGDGKSYSISVASIFAKVYRDRSVIDLSNQESYSMYSLEKHKGYGTADHLKAIDIHGLSDLHRHSFLRQRKLF